MKNNYLTVTALTKYIKRKIDDDPHLNEVWIKGEISNFNHHSRGHMYLTIKDEQTRIQSVMFAGNNRRLKFTPENGMHVLIKGEISVFEKNGQYQLYIQQMEPDGIGALYLAFEQLKKKLMKQGLFDERHKQEIPGYPRRVGVITSPTGAAVRDIIITINRRYPVAETKIIPAVVQGESAAQSIKNAIETANEQNLDVLIVGRGGGSIEDLWSFNEEIVAKAIYHSKIPIISAIGHETDVTISDYVADLRAATPTGAAELAVPSQVEIREKLVGFKRNLTLLLDGKIKNQRQHLIRMRQSYAFKYPENLIKQNEQELDKYTERLEKSLMQLTKNKQDSFVNIKTRLINQHPKNQLKQAKLNLKQLIKQKNSNMSRIFDYKAGQLTTTIEKLTLLNPLEIMKRGFAIPYTVSGEIIKSSKQIQTKDQMQVKLADGVLDCQVLDVKEGKND